MNMDDRYLPFSATFLIHEQRVRGYRLFVNSLHHSQFHNKTGSFLVPKLCFLMIRMLLMQDHLVLLWSFDQTASSTGQSLQPGLDDDTIQNILYATRNSDLKGLCALQRKVQRECHTLAFVGILRVCVVKEKKMCRLRCLYNQDYLNIYFDMNHPSYSSSP